MTLFNRFLTDESGATAIEYALIAAIIGLGLLAVLTPLRNNLQALFNRIGTGLTNA